MGPMGPRGLGPNPFSTVSPCPPGFVFSAKKASKKKKVYLFEFFAMLAKVDLNLRLKNYKIAI